MDCIGCEARDREIAFLRAQVEKLQDRAFELAKAPIQPTPPPPPTPAAPAGSEAMLDAARMTRGEDGEMYYDLDGRKVLLSVVQRVVTEGGFIDDKGGHVSVQEWNRGIDKLNEMISGG